MTVSGWKPRSWDFSQKFCWGLTHSHWVFMTSSPSFTCVINYFTLMPRTPWSVTTSLWVCKGELLMCFILKSCCEDSDLFLRTPACLRFSPGITLRYRRRHTPPRAGDEWDPCGPLPDSPGNHHTLSSAPKLDGPVNGPPPLRLTNHSSPRPNSQRRDGFFSDVGELLAKRLYLTSQTQT